MMVCFLPILLAAFLIHSVESLSNYDQTVLADSPVAYWPLAANDGTDCSGHGLNGVFNNSASASTAPNNDSVSVFNGINQYVTIGDSDYLQIVRTGILTIVAWFRPDTLQFDYNEGSGYVYWMGKGMPNGYSWSARMYSYNNSEGRYNRISGYAFNLTGGLGAGSYFEDTVIPGQWIFYTLIINTVNVTSAYPTGYTKIYKNGTYRDQDALLGYGIIPQRSPAPMRIATRQLQSFFKGAIGKVALFDYELSPSQIQTYYNCMLSNTNCINPTTAASTRDLTSASAKEGSSILKICLWIGVTLVAGSFV